MLSTALVLVVQKPWLSLAVWSMCLSVPAGPPHLLVMLILYLGCGCIDLLGHCCCKRLGLNENVFLGICPHFGLTCYFQPSGTTAFCVSARDPQPPEPLRRCSARGKDSGNIHRMKKYSSLFSYLESDSGSKLCRPLLLKDFLFNKFIFQIQTLILVCVRVCTCACKPQELKTNMQEWFLLSRLLK